MKKMLQDIRSVVYSSKFLVVVSVLLAVLAVGSAFASSGRFID